MIAVITQPLTDVQKSDPKYAGRSSYIPASCVDFLKGAGARTVPLYYDSTTPNTELSKLNRLNGVIFCDG